MINYTIYNITDSYNEDDIRKISIFYIFILFIGYGLICFILIKGAIKIDEYISNITNESNESNL
jgi:predicted RNase H-related nuclease YkuK (DUF458 family)